MSEKMTLPRNKDPSVSGDTGLNNACKALENYCKQPGAQAARLRAAIRAVSAARHHGTLGTAFSRVTAKRLVEGWNATATVVTENAPVVASVRAALEECELHESERHLPAALQKTVWTFHLLYIMVYGLVHDYLSSLLSD